MNALIPNIDEIKRHRDFLPMESIVIVANIPDSLAWRAQRFHRDDPLLINQVFGQNHSGCNVYFVAANVSPSWQGPKPPKKERIDSNPFLSADTDFRVSENAENGCARELGQMRQLVSDRVLPEPSLAVFTGGGLHFYWLLREPISPEQAEPRNLYIANKTGGDHIQNCNRLLRIAGTINYPKESKIKNGRVPLLSSIIKEAC
jgi:hypothetical protein